MALDLEALKILEARLSAREGVATGELTELLSTAFEDQRSAKDVDDFRLGTRPWKKLRDEVSPLSAFLSFKDLDGSVRFPMDSNVPDAWFTPKGSARVGIEITRALGRTDHKLAKELVREGSSRGFLELQDNASEADFVRALKRPRTMYSTQQAQNTVRAGIMRCLEAKNKTVYEGMWLLVLAPLSNLPFERWDAIVPTLEHQAALMPFDQIHVFNGRGQRSWGFQIK